MNTVLFDKERISPPKKETPFEAIYKKYVVGDFQNKIPPIGRIANEYNVSINKIQRYFQNKFGMTLYQLFVERKMIYAAQLLQQGYKCQEVSRMVGYGEISAIKFNKMFQKHFGITPKKYQMQFIKKKKQ